MDEILDISRKENKYLISVQRSLFLNELLSKTLTQDTNNDVTGYTVRTLYFDTINDNDYQDKEDGLLYRKKVRIRIYSSKDKYAKLELKEKINTNQRKRSLLISKDDVYKICSGNYGSLLNYNSKFGEQMYILMSVNNYVPKCIIEYKRKAFIVEENKTRITIDSEISATESQLDIFRSNLCTYPVTNTDHVTLEVKFNGFLLSYVKDLLNLQNTSQISNSKYCMSRYISKII